MVRRALDDDDPFSEQAMREDMMFLRAMRNDMVARRDKMLAGLIKYAEETGDRPPPDLEQGIVRGAFDLTINVDKLWNAWLKRRQAQSVSRSELIAVLTAMGEIQRAATVDVLRAAGVEDQLDELLKRIEEPVYEFLATVGEGGT